MKRIAVFPGSFDPITLGHCDIINRALPLFDKIIVAIGQNSGKNYMFSLEKRKQFLEETFKDYPNIEIDTYEGLTVDYCLRKKANFILRGLRNPADFEFEKAIAHTNRALTKQQLETVFLLTSSGKSYISSSIVRDVIKNNGNYSILVPSAVKV
ncbi:pantetheine-phosphate adenylyltransferase [Ornithobacterium rhinotracheale]|uniref:Phosphopantetheine adenylyltransferase n=1 Tax=Ornithobacterium rhinotracheale (strain ATCC 51463 / DSM 15997 / CCUG 23171 / CIP 104009 / LMG 9086) TaxID=867902 RepID=I4A2N1_ORNRL|nr:pantetheine-phosphate adenylyltransferase [Ornithobacterium rhinotracheale]AFL98215.1 pantetheine-phosphate adenylyltransferase [Ornithobacterium rhinotracheale DSM 15997]AIP99960.1 phosphopantetheine adenylyltransferase [Ornithobacterium rhinotracheale ORT-UMN 88]KGB66118.1 phosphopantetheine adenylyltransferase [Ornithobacterium rhinotracheale H06-030791]MCK0193484.1 pantetheine-phosphate adenylyltransferase [Ornithobacterium rhinotracheale]MCK0201289.1 pantetheine-phosphate adenylyltrans